VGQVKNMFIKNLTRGLIEKYPDKFTKDFEKNKKELDKIIELESKKVRNMVAGYLVHVIKKMERPGLETFQMKRATDRRKGRRRGRRRRK